MIEREFHFSTLGGREKTVAQLRKDTQTLVKQLTDEGHGEDVTAIRYHLWFDSFDGRIKRKIYRNYASVKHFMTGSAAYFRASDRKKPDWSEDALGTSLRRIEIVTVKTRGDREVGKTIHYKYFNLD